MKIIWSKPAEKALRLAADYILEEYGQRARNTFLCEVDATVRLLPQNPDMGSREPLLADRTEVYRSIAVGRLNKVVYRVTGRYIIVAALWDTRREPRRQAGKVE